MDDSGQCLIEGWITAGLTWHICRFLLGSGTRGCTTSVGFDVCLTSGCLVVVTKRIHTRLVRWRSEEMKRYQNRPHTQLAFILNLDEHWFTLRRFGPAEPDLSKDPGNGHWFNLNSCIQEPEWVSRTYLGMVLQQAETEGIFKSLPSRRSVSDRLFRILCLCCHTNGPSWRIGAGAHKG